MIKWFAGSLFVAVSALTPASAELLSKQFQFKPATTLEIGATTADELRLDSVQFALPPSDGGRFLRTGGHVKAEVAVSNVGTSTRRVGLAIALFDAEDRLVGVASGGTGLMPLKSDRQRTFTLVFDDVNAAAARATTFQITMEIKD